MSETAVPAVVEPDAKTSIQARMRLPPLDAGDRLSRAEFERRYSARPDIKKAELIEGVVYVPTPVRFTQHSRLHVIIITWLATYSLSTPGVEAGDNATVRLDFDNEVQPDALLRLNEPLGGRSHITEDDYLAGPPELIVEIAASSAAYDLHDKLRVYRRDGVQEYLVVQVYEQRVDWFTLDKGQYRSLEPDAEGVLRSQMFPGLWFAPALFWASDLAGVLDVLQQGLSTPEHAAFATRLLQAGASL